MKFSFVSILIILGCWCNAQNNYFDSNLFEDGSILFSFNKQDTAFFYISTENNSNMTSNDVIRTSLLRISHQDHSSFRLDYLVDTSFNDFYTPILFRPWSNYYVEVLVYAKTDTTDNYNWIKIWNEDLSLEKSILISKNIPLQNIAAFEINDDLFLLGFDFEQGNYLIFSIDEQLNLIETNVEIPLSFDNSVFLNADSNLVIIHNLGIAIVDTSYQILQNKLFNVSNVQDYGDVIEVDSILIVHGLRQGPNIGQVHLVFNTYDPTLNLLTKDSLISPTGSNIIFLNKSVELSETYIYTAGMIDVSGQLLSAVSPNAYVVSQYNKDQSLNWRKELGGSQPYIMYGIQDLGENFIMAYGSTRDLNSNARVPFYTIIDETGTTTGTKSQQFLSSELVQIENPVSDAMHINVLEPDKHPSIILTLTGINGQLAFRAKLQGSTSQINLGLPSGLYCYDIRSESKPKERQTGLIFIL